MDQIISILEKFGVATLFFVWYIFVDKPKQEKRYDDAITSVKSSAKECFDKIDLLIKNHFERIEDVLRKCDK